MDGKGYTEDWYQIWWEVQGVGDYTFYCKLTAPCVTPAKQWSQYTGAAQILSADYSYNMIKKQMQGGDPNYRTSSGQHLLAAAEASEYLAIDRDKGLTRRCDHGNANESNMGCQDQGLCYREE